MRGLSQSGLLTVVNAFFYIIIRLTRFTDTKAGDTIEDRQFRDSKKEEFVPVVEKKANIYVSGPTVYNYFHIGNARPFIIFDTLRRYLQFRGYDVTYVQNFTDVDDKMIKEAEREGITVKELGERFIGEYFKDAGALNIKKADVHPKATEHIGE